DELPENEAAVINFNADGTDMAILAVKDSNGEIHTSFDTCQVCNGSPKAYFKEKNGMLQCQNCGNRFTLDAVGSEAYGCNPIKVDEAAVSRTDTGITVSGDYLIANAELFANWKK
ncbi:MAG: Fe-S-containing protein, partial [Candidatus Ornithomonoglobus sp.]